eukprot:scaffold5631_cov55-Phaeocystis_antarctica.AAC.2
MYALPLVFSFRAIANTTPLHGHCPAAAPGRFTGELVLRRRSRAQRRSPIVVRGRLLELRRRASPRLPNVSVPGQRVSPHLVGFGIVRRCPDNPHRQRLELLVVPPLRLGHLGARLLCQHDEGR